MTVHCNFLESIHPNSVQTYCLRPDQLPVTRLLPSRRQVLQSWRNSLLGRPYCQLRFKERFHKQGVIKFYYESFRVVKTVNRKNNRYLNCALSPFNINLIILNHNICNCCNNASYSYRLFGCFLENYSAQSSCTCVSIVYKKIYKNVWFGLAEAPQGLPE